MEPTGSDHGENQRDSKELKRIHNNKIRNEDLYEKCGVKEWSKIIKERRLRWYGHLLRLTR